MDANYIIGTKSRSVTTTHCHNLLSQPMPLHWTAYALAARRGTVTTYAITLGHTNNTTYVIIRVPRVTPSAPECVTCAVISLMNGLIHALNVSKHSLRQAREGGGGLRA